MTNEDRKIIEEYVDKMTKSFSNVLFTEIQGLKDDVKEIKESISKTNDCLAEVNKWSSGHQAIHDAQDNDREKNLKTIGVVIAFLAMASGVFFGFASINKKYERTEQRIEMLDNFQRMQERYLEYKFKETPIVPVTRGVVIKKDTINKK